ncbi:uncharacterized protein ARMOST_15254 [Armillaria ostoyae]|uniref:Uncharacterized protein n=1 Tax=Armillaria ostoyae TaxID=47428 RepID=A0A284RSU8_ARMOS|nr:uncharacterized protein ARMOST_15254 [Armillaria ostoyae]
MQRQRYVALGGPSTGLHDTPPPLDYDRILPITIKAMPDVVDLLEELVGLFPEHMLPDQMASIIKRSDKVAKISNEIKSKIYCVLDRKTALGRIRMMFITDNFKEVVSFLHNGNHWKREPSLRDGLLYMLKDIQGGEPYVPITPPKPSASSSNGYRWEHSASSTWSSRQPTLDPTLSSSSTSLPMPQYTGHSSLSASKSTTMANSGQKVHHCRTCGERMKGHGKIPCICQWCGRPKLSHNGKVCQPQAPFSAARALSASKGKGRETFQTPESQSIQSSSKGKERVRSESPDSDSEVGLELEERVTRLEELFHSFMIDGQSTA